MRGRHADELLKSDNPSIKRILGGSPLKIDRSLNALWTKAGILCAPPIR